MESGKAEYITAEIQFGGVVVERHSSLEGDGWGDRPNTFTSKTQKSYLKTVLNSFLRKQDFFFMIAREIRIRGKVQGVFFRASAKAKADESGLYGWVKNDADDLVVMWVEGPEPLVLQMIEWCWRGPERAKVKDVVVKVVEMKRYRDFEVIR